MKYSIIMPYYRRYKQLKETLLSFQALYPSRDDYELIIVVDHKDDEDAFIREELLEQHHNAHGITGHLLRMDPAVMTNSPSSMFNEGASQALGDYLILTNPECCHENDVLGGLDKCMTPRKYIVCACRCDEFKNMPWLQHSTLNNRLLHFCSCIHRDAYEAFGGFDEAYGYGVGYDDDDLLRTIQTHTDLEIEPHDELVVYHQAHDRSHQADTSLTDRNRVYFEDKWA